MLEQLFGGLQDIIQQQTDGNQENAQQSTQMVQSSFMEAIKSQISQGNVSQVMNMFNGQSDEQTQQNIQSQMAGQLQQQGMNTQMIQQMMQQVFPLIMQKFMSKETGNTQNGVDFLSLLGLGQDNNLMGMLGNLLNNNQNQQNNTNQNDEGLGGLINKLF